MRRVRNRAIAPLSQARRDARPSQPRPTARRSRQARARLRNVAAAFPVPLPAFPRPRAVSRPALHSLGCERPWIRPAVIVAVNLTDSFWLLRTSSCARLASASAASARPTASIERASASGPSRDRQVRPAFRKRRRRRERAARRQRSGHPRAPRATVQRGCRRRSTSRRASSARPVTPPGACGRAQCRPATTRCSRARTARSRRPGPRPAFAESRAPPLGSARHSADLPAVSAARRC